MVRSIATLVLSAALLLPSGAHAEEDQRAAQAFQAAHQEVSALIDSHAPDKRVEARVDDLIDYHYMAVAALGGPKKYAQRCGERCAEYEALLGQLIQRAYLKRLRAKDRGKVEYLDEIVRPRASRIETRVRFVDAQGNKRKVRLSYVMHRPEGSWRVREIYTDGVSLTANYRTQLKKLYSEGGIDRIITQLQAKVAEKPKG